MSDDAVQTMVTTDPHQNQDLVVPAQVQEQHDPLKEQENQENPFSGMAAFDPEKMGQGPVNAITVLTLLDKLVNMLDVVQENQHKMEAHQVEMEGVVRGIQADMFKLSKSHSHTSNTVSKLLDKSRKLSVTMKEVRDKMERQGAQVKKLEANHAHLANRNTFKVLIFQEENEIPASVFVKDAPPFPRDEILEEADELAPGVEGDQPSEGGFHTIDLSSDEDVGLEEDQEEEMWAQDLENMEKSRAEKLKHSSLKKVDSLKKAFSRQNIEKKMTKIGTKIVSAEQREKIKQKTSSLKVSPLTFGIKKPRGSSDLQPPEEHLARLEEGPVPEDHVQLSPLGGPEQEVTFTEIHQQMTPAEQQEEEPGPAEVSVTSEGVSEEYALSATLLQDQEPKEEPSASLEE
ncbi:caveolae-associated protein 2-like [Dunckerocampus dactyliophorus]|uniref:caveolae-associated protein 2-like n=1 Tax=Dunckerocampus dactyliophorus TaxID=161453 RepID=UPI00240757A8|nr:caveolae-associated protein 2-like [Dunckerocampus dactyliophorus]